MYTREEIDKIVHENEELKRKLSVAQSWMKREVRNQIKNVAMARIKEIDSPEGSWNDLSPEELEKQISDQIVDYFGDILLLNAPTWTIDAITASEIHFYHMKKNDKLDWLAVVSWYHKVFDALIETLITKNYRKFAKKQKWVLLRVNDPIEKSLNLVVNKKYILGTGRLYAIIWKIRRGEELYEFWQCFKDFLDKYPELKDILLDNYFYFNFTKLNRLEVLWKKRHKWVITYKDTEIAREMLLGNLEDEKSIFYMMMKAISGV